MPAVRSAAYRQGAVASPACAAPRKAGRSAILAIAWLALAAGGASDPAAAGERPYWQQDVRHRIEVRLDTQENELEGRLVLDYRNNSPDTLLSLYFHLYQNAFRRGSLMDHYRRRRGDRRFERLRPEKEGGCEVRHVRDGAGQPLGVRIRGTILEVTPVGPILPGDTLSVAMDFTTRYGEVQGRMQKLGDQYQATQWYPRIAVYDHRRGWNIDEHIGFEFYGEYGSFDVAITLPGEYIVAATGVLQNREEVLPAERREALDIGWYSGTLSPDERPPIPDPPDSILTWRFRAEDVHDFAWVADPTFRIGESEWDGIEVYSFARERNAARWQDADSICAEFLRVFSRNAGRYLWPQHSVVDASSGMEYPMLSLDGGHSPDYYGLIGHELGHNWFQGMVGSNETYRAFLDEGFTNFITAWAADELFDPACNGKYWYARNPFERRFGPCVSHRYIRNTRLYVNHAHSGYLDPLALHSHDFSEYQSYRQVYYKTTCMLESLRLVLGDAVFERAFRAYFERWKLRHPYPEDFIAVVEEVSGRQLDWFFDQWLHGLSVPDFAVAGVSGEWQTTGAGERRYVARVALERKGGMVLPLDLDLELEDGSAERFHIPVEGSAKNEPGRRVLPEWEGRGAAGRSYEAELVLPVPPRSARIPGGERYGDLDGRDNVWRRGLRHRWQPFGPVRLSFDNTQIHYGSLDAYDLLWRPSLGYTDPDGLWIGLSLHGSYLDEWWTRFDQLRLRPRIGLASGRPGYELSYDTPVRWLGRLSRWYLESAVVDGRSWQEIGLRKVYRERLTEGPESRLEAALRSRQVMEPADLAPGLAWNGRINHSLVLSAVTAWEGRLNPQVDLLLETALGGATPAATRASAGIRTTLSLGGLSLEPRAFGAYVSAAGRDGCIDPERVRELSPWLYSPSRATTMDLFEESFYRVDGALPDSWWRKGKVVHSTGPWMRGFAGIGHVANRIWTAALDVEISAPLRSLIRQIFPAGIGRLLALDLVAYYEAGNLSLRADDRFRFPPDPLQSAGLTLLWRAPFTVPGLPGNAVGLHLPLWLEDPRGLSGEASGWSWRWAVEVGMGG